MTIREIVKNVGKFGGGIASGLSIHSWVKELKNGNDLNTTVKDLIERDMAKENMVKELLEEKITNIVSQDRVRDAVESTRKSFEKAIESDKTLTKLNSELSKANLSSTDKANLENEISSVKNTFNSSLEESSKLYDQIESIINNKGGKLVSNYQDLFNYFQSFIDNLTHYQKFAFIHISSSIFIVFCLFTLIAVFNGNQLIDYFKLSTRYPKLEKYIKLRQKFQLYYFYINSLFILLTLIIIISLNLFALSLG